MPSAQLVSSFGLLMTAGLSFAFVLLVPPADASQWRDAPLAGVALHLIAPEWLRLIPLLAVVFSAVAFLTAGCRSAAAGAQTVLARLADEGLLDPEFRRLHVRFGTPFRLIDAAAATQVAIVLVSGGEGPWLARAYGIAIGWCAVVKTVALIRFRFLRPGPRAYRVPLNFAVGRREWPVGLMLLALVVAAGTFCLVATLDGPSIGAIGVIAGLTALFAVSERVVAGRPPADAPTLDEFQLLPTEDVTLRQVEATDKGLALAREEFEREWNPDLHIKLERVSSEEARVIVTNLAKTSVLLQLLQLRKLSHAMPFERFRLNDPLVGGMTWSQETGKRILACTGYEFDGPLAASVTFYAAGRMYRTDWFRAQIVVREGRIVSLEPSTMSSRRVRQIERKGPERRREFVQDVAGSGEIGEIEETAENKEEKASAAGA